MLPSSYLSDRERHPASKIADLNCVTLLPLNRTVGDFKFTIQIDMSSVEGISPAMLENQFKKTIHFAAPFEDGRFAW